MANIELMNNTQRNRNFQKARIEIAEFEKNVADTEMMINVTYQMRDTFNKEWYKKMEAINEIQN
jgi:hypothetical protein